MSAKKLLTSCQVLVSNLSIHTEIKYYPPFTGTGPLDVRIKRLAGQRDDLQDTVRRLKLDLEEERSRSSLARGAASQEELERCRHQTQIMHLALVICHFMYFQGNKETPR